MKQNLQLFLFAGLLFLLSACEEGVLGPRQPVCLEISQENSNGTSFERDYNSQGISEIYAYQNGSSLYYNSFTYNNLGQIVENHYHNLQNSSVTPPEILTYDDKGNWVKSTATYSNGDEIYYTVEYDAQNQMKRLISSSKRAGTARVNFTIEYEWEGGNNTKRTYVSSVMRQVMDYEFDLNRENKRRKEQKKIAFLSLTVAHNKNMYRKQTTTTTDIASGAISESVQNYTYTYDSQGYPTQLTRTSTTNNGAPVTSTSSFQYSCD